MSELRRYPDYKDSGVQWLGDIPSHWEAKRMRFFVNTNPLKSELGIQEGLLVSFVPMESVAVDGGLTLTTDKEISDVYKGYTYFRNNDVVMAKITPCFENGKASICHNLTNDIGFGTTELHVLRPKEETSSRFLFYLIRSDVFMKIGESEMYGAGGQKRVPESFIKNFVAPLPDIDEQQAIVNFLDDKLDHIDALISKQQQLIEKLAEQRSAVITHAVTKGLNSNVPMKDSSVEWLGEIPNGWQIIGLQYVSRLRSGSTVTALDFKEDGNFPVYGGNGLRGRIDSFTHDGKYILIGRQGALCGNVKLAEGRFFASEHALVAHPVKSYDEKWLYYLLNAMNLNQYSTSAAQPGISAEIIGRLRIPFPQINEQAEIANYLDNETQKIDQMNKATTDIITKLQEYRAALITQAVTGKIDVRHLNQQAS